MRRLIPVILLGITAHAATVFRVDPVNVMTTAGNVPPGANPILYAVPGASINVCSDAACATAATTYQDSTGNTACPNTAQVVLAGTTLCTPTSGPQGQFGFWLPIGALYYYKVTLPNGTVYGPFPISSSTAGVAGITAGTGISVSGSTGNVTVTNTGLLGMTGATGLSCSTSSQNTTCQNTGVLAVTGATGISCSTASGSATCQNTGILGVTGGTGISCVTSSGNTTCQNTEPGTAIPSGTQTQVLELGPNTGNNTTLQFSSKPILITSDFNYPAITPSSPPTLTGGAGLQVITLPVCPLGIYGHGYWAPVYISGGTGTAESKTPQGGTCLTATLGIQGGTIIISPSNNHSGAWTVSSSTAGIEEAILTALSSNPAAPPEVYLPGGPSSGLFVYDQIYFPPCKDFRFSSGNTVINWPSTFTGDAILIDSCEDCDYRLPLTIYYGSNSTVHIKPTNPDPSTITAFIDSSVILWSANQAGGASAGNAYMYIDGSSGTINKNYLEVFEAYDNSSSGVNYGILTGGTVGQNTIVAQDINGATLDLAKDTSSAGANVWDITGSVSITSAVGADVNGQRSRWKVNIANGSGSTNKSLVVESTAVANSIYATSLDGGYANNSTNYNRLFISDFGITNTGKPVGYSVATPSFPASLAAVKNTTLTPVIVQLLTAGGGGQVSITDQFGVSAGATFALAAGQQFYLDVNESISFNYSGSAPTWQWRGIP